MDTEGKPPQKDFADEMESLHQEIAHLQNLIRDESPVAPPQKSSSEASETSEIQNSPAEAPVPARLLEYGPLGMALVDAEYRLVSPNRALLGMLSYMPQEAPSLHIADIAQDAESCIQLIRWDLKV